MYLSDGRRNGPASLRSTVRHWDIRLGRSDEIRIFCRNPLGTGLAPRLKLVPAALTHSGQRLRLRRFRKFHRRKSSRSEQRVRQRPILGSQSGYVCLEKANIFQLKHFAQPIQHEAPVAQASACAVSYCRNEKLHRLKSVLPTPTRKLLRPELLARFGFEALI